VKKDDNNCNEIEKKQTEILNIEERYQILVQESGDVFEIINPDGTVKYISETSKKVIHYEPEKMIGRKVYEFYKGKELKKIMEMVDFALKNPSKKTQNTVAFNKKNGDSVYLEVKIQNLLNNPVIDGLVLNFRDVTTRVKLEKRMRYISTHDELSGLPNRLYFKNELENLCKTSQENEKNFAAIILHIDGLKYIVDALGFRAGEQLIIQLMIRLKGLLGSENFISRYSEDQFGMIVKDGMSFDGLEKLGQEILGLFSRVFKVDSYEFEVTMSMGIAIFPDLLENQEIDSENEEISNVVIKSANIARLWARKEGKNRYKFYSSDINIQNYKELELRHDLKKAIEKNQLKVFYQPIVELKTSEIIAVEALVRWIHPVWGMVEPKEFISLAEETGAIIEMGKWVLREVCRDYQSWIRKRYHAIKVAVNFSSIQFYEKNFLENVKNILEEFKLNPKFLIVELKESLLIEDKKKASYDIKGLQSFGIQVALDDFGTGFSSLAYLNTFNIDIIKMDGVFLKNISDKNNAIIARTIINLAQELDVKFVAEKIENSEQLGFLRKLNCYAGQGYYYSKPVGIDDFEKILETGKCKPAVKNSIVKKPVTNRRKFFRLEFFQLLKGDVSISKIKGEEMKLGDSKILIKNIGPGGLCFISNIIFPIQQLFTLKFNTVLLNNKIRANGNVVWSKEIDDNLYQYGVRFDMEEKENDDLMKTIFDVQIKMKTDDCFMEGSFTSHSPRSYFNLIK
jgi:diguanylate cyclase (GGDEF)-like protein/PAS domain S-box-containing protein